MALAGRVWAEIGGDASGLKKAANEAKNALKEISSSANSAGGIAGKAMVAMTAAAAVAFAAIKAGMAIFDFSAEGAQIASLKNASYKLADSYGTNMGKIVTAVKDASFNTITEYDAMKSANLAMTMGVTTNAETIGNLMEIAIMRGRAFGLTTEDAFERITRGIGRLSPKILDDIGFNMKGVTTQAGMLAAVLAQGNKELEDMGGLTKDVSTAYQMVGAAYGDFFNNLKMGAAYGFLNLITDKDTAVSAHQAGAKQAMYEGSYTKYYNALSRAINAAAAQGDSDLVQKLFEQRSRKVFAAAERANYLNQYAQWYQQQTGGAEVVTEATKELNRELELQVGLASELTKAQESYIETLDKYGAKSWRTKEAVGQLSETYKDFFRTLMGDFGMSVSAQLELGVAMGEIPKRELAAFAVGEKLFNMYDQHLLTIDQLAAALDNAGTKFKELSDIEIEGKSLQWTIDLVFDFATDELPQVEDWFTRRGGGGLTANVEVTSNADEVFQEIARLETDTYSTHTIYVNTVHGSWSTSGRSIVGGGVAGNPGSYARLMMHGGAIGGEHGMMVPPGFGNDGMPVWVSSGERLDVTPAGNKNTGNDDLISEMRAVRRKLEDLPTAIRDSILLAV